MTAYRISRSTTGETVAGKALPARVYITGPHFGQDIYSSTEHADEAAQFTREEAERLLASGKWQHSFPQMEPLA